MNNLAALINAGSSSFSNLLFRHFKDTDLTPTELVVYLFITQYVQTHTEAPDLQALASDAKLAPKTFMDALSTLCTKGAVELQTSTDASGKLVDHYDVTPLLAKLANNTVFTSAPLTSSADGQVKSIRTQIETELSRLLTPIEQQMIRDWLAQDHYAPELILLALREAVMNHALSLKYMDRILIRWEKQHLTTPEAVRRHQEKFDAL